MKRYPKLASWSYSTYVTWRGCPRRARYEKIEKLPRPSSPALDRGSRIHAEAEGYVKRELVSPPASLAKFRPEFRALRASSRSRPELELAFAHGEDLREPWTPVAWRDPAARLRAKLDLFQLRGRFEDAVRIIDYKTGREYPDHVKQLELYALIAFRTVPRAREVTVELWYLDSGATSTSTYLPSHASDLAETWHERTEPMLRDTVYAPMPSAACRFCPFSKAAKGPCEFY